MDGLSSCRECGHEASGQARFCERCGAALAPGGQPLRAPDSLAEKIASQRSAIVGERKQVTVMFTDIVRSMELTRALEAERWGLLLDRFLAIACRAIHDFEGTVNQFTGDGLMAVFGAPLAHEDHARRACLATLRLQRDLDVLATAAAREHGIEFLVRCGLNSGEVIVGEIGDDLHMDFAPIGNTSGMGKRMEALAPPGSSAISATTAALIEGEFELRELGKFEVKGVTEPQLVFELRGPAAAKGRLEAAEARGLSTFVGRVQERAILENALNRAAAGKGQVVGVSGDPGVGKSRLCREFMADCREQGLTINTGAALAHGRSTPLLPVLAMFRDFFGIGEDSDPVQARKRIEDALATLDPGLSSELPLVFDFLGIPDDERPSERIDPEARQRRLLSFVSGLVAARSRVTPGLVVLEDLHWIDDASAVFLDELVVAAQRTRTLLIVTFRPEYEPAWSGNYRKLDLAPLSDHAAAELLEQLLGDDASLDGLAEQIRDRTAGNPFFIEEVVRALAEVGHLSGSPGEYRLVGGSDQLVLPASVQAVIAARLDRLPREQKALVQTMSVIGREIPVAVLERVSDRGGRDLAASMVELESAGFVAEAHSDDRREFVFRHPLTQAVAYESQLSASRAAAHAAVAVAVESLYPDALEERAALLAYHSEAAGNTLAAARWHARAAVWISASAPAEAMRHWRSARELTDEIESAAEAEALGTTARLGMLSLAWRLGMPHREAASIHLEGLDRLDDEQASERVLFDMAYGGTLFLGRREHDGMQLARAAAERAFELGEPGLALSVTWPASFEHWVLGPVAAGVDLADRALELAGDETSAGAGLVVGCPYAACLWTGALCAAYVGRLERTWRDYKRAIELAREHGDLETESYALASRGVLRAELFYIESALADAERSVEVAERSGSVDGLVSAYVSLAYARSHAYDLRGAEAAVRQALRMSDERQVALENEPVMLAVLARTMQGLGDVASALDAARQAIAIAEERSIHRLGIYAFVVWARLLMAVDGLRAAEQVESALARALQLAKETEGLLHEPKIRVERAALARLRGDYDQAERQEAEAGRILEACGAADGTLEGLRERDVRQAKHPASGPASARR